MRRLIGSMAIATLVSFAFAVVHTQSAALRIVSAGPIGEVNQLSDANEIRVIFSEPMVALGRIPVNPTPPWIHIAPAIAGTFRWSGTTVLVFTPDLAKPLPYSTRYTVTVDATAASDAGRVLGAPYEFSFTTPTVKLVALRWYRRDQRFDRPVLLLLEFNQPVRPAEVAAHAAVRYEPHEVSALPVTSSRERARAQAIDPAGLARLDAKVAAARATAARQDAVAVRLADDWDKKTFPPKDSLVALETSSVPPPGAHLRLTLDASITGLQGTAPPAQAQQSVAELAAVFFARTFMCSERCDPSSNNGLEMTGEVSVAKFAAALSVRDITSPPRESLVARKTIVKASTFDRSTYPTLEDAGYDRQPPAHTYAYRLDPALEAEDGQRLGYPWIGIVENWHERAFTSFGDGHGVWEAAGGAQLPFYSRNLTGVTEWFAPIAPADLAARVVALQKNNFKDLPPGAGTPRRLAVTADATQSYGIDLSSALKNGFGLIWAGLKPGDPIAQSVRATSDDDTRSTIVQVTNLGVSVKDSPQSTLVFVTRLDTGDPVAGAAVTIVSTDSRELWRGTTGADGIAMAPALPLRKPDRWYDLSFLVTAEKNGDVAYLGSDWNEGIQPWDFGHPYELWESTDILRGAVFTDRGVYKPGEDVHVKAVVRTDTPTGIRLLPGGSTLDIQVRDSRNREVDHRTVTLNRWSSAEWTWTVPADGTLGNYSLRAMLPGAERPAANPDLAPRVNPGNWLRQVHGGFLVAAYRRPDFRVDAALQAVTPIAGSSLSGTIDGHYLFGSAMSGRTVRWSITRDPDTEVPQAIYERFPEDRFVFGYQPERERATERVTGADATLDASGRVVVSASAARDVDFAYRYTLEGDVEDVSREHIADRASVVVHPAPWYIGLERPGFFVDASAGAKVGVVAAALGGQPVAGVAVTLTLTRIQWNSVRHAEGGGFYAWDSEEVRVPAGEWHVTTAETPAMLHIPVPEGGDYQLAATASDGDGHKTRTETSFFVLGKGYTAWQRYDHNRIELQPEKKTWKPGDRARVMIESPWESATALVTLEREGIRRYERFTLTSTQQTIEVPITEADIPNVFVSVLLVRGRTAKDPGPAGDDTGKPQFRLGYAELQVEDATKQLSVSVTADRAEYRPANTAHVAVTVTDTASRPTASEVTLWAVDYGVLSLTNYQAPDVLHAVYQEKALQVMNEDSRQRIISRRVLTPKGDGEGGGGGAENGAGALRRDFRPLAFWLGSVETDGSGRASRDVTLPESLTTYRIMAVAGDGASRFGSASAEIKVSKPVTLLPAFPRFMSLGDRASFGGVVTNTLSTGGSATVSIRSLDPGLLQFAGDGSQTLTLGAGSTEPVRFDATARGVGTARVQMTVTLGSETDAFETTLPVSAPSPFLTEASFGDTDSRSAQRLAIPANIVPGVGGLTVSLASTALVGLDESARYLVDYPYGCAEQKASAALALLLAADLGDAFSMPNIAPADYRARATSLLRELPRYQCGDGGFGYWAGSCQLGNVYLTSYVLHVLKVAGTMNVAADGESVTRALDFLEAALKKSAPPGQVQWQPVWSASNAFAVKVLAEYGRNQDSNINRLLTLADRLPVFALSYVADALSASNLRDQRYDDVIRRLTNALHIDGDRAHVEELNPEALLWIWSTNTRSTAIVLDGFVHRGDAPAFVPGLVRWLVAARQRGRWGNTQENATALESLVAYYRTFESEVPDMTATVAVQGGAIGTATFRGRSTAAADVRLAMPDLLRQVPAGAERELAVSRAGVGRVYYSARLQYAPTDPVPAAESGIHIERRYEKYVENGEGPVLTSFSAGDLIRVTLTVTVPAERRYVAVTDALPAGVEAVDGWFRTTASDLARDASAASDDQSPWWWERGGFDHVEKYDDRVVLFATRLADGRHQFSYLVRATTTGTFRTAGPSAEEMYAPEVSGRGAPATIDIR